METATMNTMAMDNQATAGGFFSGIDGRSFAIGVGAGVIASASIYGVVKGTQMAINHHREKALEAGKTDPDDHETGTDMFEKKGNNKDNK